MTKMTIDASEIRWFRDFKRSNDDERQDIIDMFKDKFSPKCDQRYKNNMGFMCYILEKKPWHEFLEVDFDGKPFKYNFMCTVDHCPLLQ